jgi:glycosyltransferase involved in cell wall biosynthesis
MNTGGLAVIETHPIQYHAPVYRAVQQEFGIPVTAVYASDFSLAGYRDLEFGADFAWDSDLLSGYSSIFLERQAEGGARLAEEASTKGLRQALQRLQPDVVMLVGHGTKFHWSAILRALGCGRPLLMRAESTDHARARTWLKAMIRDRILKSLYARISRLLYVGQRSREHFQRLGCAADKMIFSPYCVDTAPFQTTEIDRASLREPSRLALRIEPWQKVVLFSGKLSKRKGVDILVKAARSLPETLRQEVVLVFLGSGELHRELEEMASVEPVVNVRFIGFQNQSRLSQFYHSADLLVLPSLYSETWGLVVNEAMHHGIATVVSSGVGCAPDLVEPGITGEVCDAGDAGALSAAIRKALAWCTTPDVRRRCRDRVAGYSIKEAARGIAQAYHLSTNNEKAVVGGPSI